MYWLMYIWDGGWGKIRFKRIIVWMKVRMEASFSLFILSWYFGKKIRTAITFCLWILFFFLRIRCVISTLIKHFWKIDQNNFKLSIDGHHYELASPVVSLGVFGKLWIKIALCKMYLSNVVVEYTIFRNGFS